MMSLSIASRPPILLEGADLLAIGAWQSGVGGESPSLTIDLDPGRRDLATLLDPPPLRAPATLSEDGTDLFLGLVQSVRLGASASITLES